MYSIICINYIIHDCAKSGAVVFLVDWEVYNFVGDLTSLVNDADPSKSKERVVLK